jgi:hypothetical protein
MVNTQKYSNACLLRILGVLRRGASLALALALSAFLAGCGEVKAMGEVVLFSAVSGKVVDQGKPLAGIKLERETKWTWGKETINDHVVSGADGSFSFPAIKRKMLLGSILPHEAIIRQEIKASLNGSVREVWLANKRNYENNGELSYVDDNLRKMTNYRDPSKPIRVTCDLSGQPTRRGGIYGLCEFD